MAAFAVELTGKLTNNAQPWSLKYLLPGWPLTEEVLVLTLTAPASILLSLGRGGTALYGVGKGVRLLSSEAPVTPSFSSNDHQAMIESSRIRLWSVTQEHLKFLTEHAS